MDNAALNKVLADAHEPFWNRAWGDPEHSADETFRFQ